MKDQARAERPAMSPSPCCAPDGSVAGHFALVFDDDRFVADLAVAVTRSTWGGRDIVLAAAESRDLLDYVRAHDPDAV